MTDAPSIDNPLKDFWFFPIVAEIEKFENASEVFGDFASITLPESPDWIVQCAWNQVHRWREPAGIERYDRIRARQVGAAVGAKSSMCETLAAGNLWFSKLPRKAQDRLVEIFGADEVAEAKVIWSQFEKVLRPKFRRVRRFALDLTMSQNLGEQVQFHQGITQGLKFMEQVRYAAHPQDSKQNNDFKKRSLVCMFAIEHWDIIEAARHDLRWADLMNAFDESFYGRHADIDEETFKKILQRSGLSIGKVGRPKESKSRRTI